MTQPKMTQQQLAHDMLAHILKMDGGKNDPKNAPKNAPTPAASSNNKAAKGKNTSPNAATKDSPVATKIDLEKVDSTPFTHVIFDMDGLLLNTEDLYTEIMSKLAGEHGCEYTWEMKVKLMGTPLKEGAQKAVDLMKLPITADEYLTALHKYKEELFPTCQLMPGAERLVRHLDYHDIPISIASGSATKDFTIKTTNHKEFFENFPIVVLGDNPNLKKGKPAPDQFLLTSSKFFDSPTPDSVLVFEDSPNGVLAARAAGMGVILVPDERLDKTMYHGPTQALKSLLDFQPELYGFPPYDEPDVCE